MPDLWTEALAEAYANSTDEIVFSTLEIYHPTFDAPVRVVAEWGDILEYVDDQPLFGKMFTLEADAERNAGESVAFLSCAFDFALPEREAGKLPSVTVTIDNVSEHLTPYFEEIANSSAAMTVVYREFIESASTPQYVLGAMTMEDISVKENSISGTASFGNLVNKNFPDKVYSATEFKGLTR